MRLGKVLVVGAGEAGKSTLIKALAPGAMNLEINGRTIAMDHAVLRREHDAVSLVGVPGQERFAPVREVLATGAVCAVWVHRAGGPVDGATVNLMATVAGRGVPYVVFVNRHDCEESEDGWRDPQGLLPPVAVIAGNLLDPKNSLEELQRVVWSAIDCNRRD